MLRPRSPLLGIVLVCAGCAAPPRTRQPPRPPQHPTTPTHAPVHLSAPPVNLSGYSNAFKQGYGDGCASARGALQRDDARYRSDTDYMMGWGDGNSVCRARR